MLVHHGGYTTLYTIRSKNDDSFVLPSRSALISRAARYFEFSRPVITTYFAGFRVDLVPTDRRKILSCGQQQTLGRLQYLFYSTGTPWARRDSDIHLLADGFSFLRSREVGAMVFEERPAFFKGRGHVPWDKLLGEIPRT
jgi:hypothetical protein